MDLNQSLASCPSASIPIRLGQKPQQLHHSGEKATQSTNSNVSSVYASIDYNNRPSPRENPLLSQAPTNLNSVRQSLAFNAGNFETSVLLQNHRSQIWGTNLPNRTIELPGSSQIIAASSSTILRDRESWASLSSAVKHLESNQSLPPLSKQLLQRRNPGQLSLAK